MKAIVFEASHQSIKIHDIPTPVPNTDNISVKMIAASLNHRDVWMTKGLYAGLTPGTVLGSCGVGTWNNETVLINPNINWGNNPNYPNHKTYSILGMPISGTFGEYLITQKDRIVAKPTHLTDIQAAALPLAGLTAYRALFGKAKLTPKDKVLINGIGGGVALMAFQFAVAIGAEVYVTSSSEEKIAKAIEMGAKGGFNYTMPKWGKAFSKKYGGVDVIIDSAGGEGFGELLRIANPLGRIAVYGGTRGISKLSPQNLFWKELQIFGDRKSVV